MIDKDLPRWFLFKTKAGAEADVAGALRKLDDIFAFLPIDVSIRRARTGRIYRRIEVRTPVFPRFVFVKVGLARLDACHVAGVAGVMGSRMDGKPLWLGDVEVKRIQLAEAAGAFNHVKEDKNLAPGDLLRVRRGPFTGYQVRFVSHLPNERVKALMSVFGREGPVVLHKDHLERAA